MATLLQPPTFAPSRPHIPHSSPHRHIIQLLQKDKQRLLDNILQLAHRQEQLRTQIDALFSLHLMVQSVILAAVIAAGVHPHVHPCAFWWVPFALSLLACSSTVYVVGDRMLDIGYMAWALEQMIALLMKVERALEELSIQGWSVNVPKAGELKEAWGRRSLGSRFSINWRDHIFVHIWGVLCVSTVLASMVLLSCSVLLCD